MDELLKNQKVKEVINKILKKHYTELSIGIVFDSKIKIYEYNNSGIPYYDIGSISKVFTSIIILKMGRDGLINLDDEINKYLDLKPQRYPTTKELLSHKTGYSYVTPSSITIQSLLKGYSRKNIYENVKNDKIINTIERIGYRNNKYGYSDFSYAILTLIIEKIYGKKYIDVFSEFIENNFGLLDTKVINNSIKRKESYLGNKSINNWNWKDDNPYLSAGGIASSIKDMTNFIDMLINKNDEYINDAFQIDQTDDKHNTTFFLSKNHHVYSHIGGVGTFRSSLSINKKRKIGIIILSNHKGYRKGNVSYLNKMIYNYLRRGKIII